MSPGTHFLNLAAVCATHEVSTEAVGSTARVFQDPGFSQQQQPFQFHQRGAKCDHADHSDGYVNGGCWSTFSGRLAVRPNFTLSYGLRFETQNAIHDHGDFAPR
jgi:hypothetical protein